MKHTKIFLIAALLGTVLASCQKEVDVKPEEKPVDTKSWTLTVKATMDQGTKAMSLEGTTLKSYWSAGETVGVYLGDKKVGILTASNVTNEGANADLSGTLTDIEGLTTSNVFTLIFPDKDVLTYLGQDGSSPAAASQTMANSFDYATATVTISEIDPSTMVITAGSNADFTSLQSIYRLRFKEDGGSYFNVNSISITSSLNTLVRTMGPVNDLMDSDCGTLTMVPTVTPQDYYYYMAIRNENTVDDQTYSFSVVRNDNALLEGVKSIPATALKYPAYIPVTVKMSQKVKMSSETVDKAL